jgi:hypothetical protein
MKRKRLSALCRAAKRTRQDLRERPSRRFDNDDSHLTKAFHRFAAGHVLPLVTITGYKQDAKRTAIMQMVQQLLLTGRAEHCVADSRDWHEPGAEFRSKLWDSLEAAGLVDSIKGSEQSGKVTRYGASDKLLELCEPLTTEDLIGGTELHRNSITPDDPKWHALVVLQSKKAKETKRMLLTIPQGDLDAVYRGIRVGDYLELVEDTIERINRSNTSHSWQAFKLFTDDAGRHGVRTIQPNVCLKQKHSGGLFEYARLYTWSTLSAQSLSSRERAMMRIDGEEVTELDYRGSQLRLLYHLEGIEPDAGDDVYRPHKILPRVYAVCDPVEWAAELAGIRELVKVATTICFNAKSPGKACLAIREELRKCRSHVVDALECTERIQPKQLVERIIKAHRKVAHKFFTEIGSQLTTVENIVMLRVLESFALERRPALCMHDGILCKRSDGDFARAMMKIHYVNVVRFEPVIKVAF